MTTINSKTKYMGFSKLPKKMSEELILDLFLLIHTILLYYILQVHMN